MMLDSMCATRSVSSRRAAIASASSDSACSNLNLLGSILLKILVYRSVGRKSIIAIYISLYKKRLGVGGKIIRNCN